MDSDPPRESMAETQSTNLDDFIYPGSVVREMRASSYKQGQEDLLNEMIKWVGKTPLERGKIHREYHARIVRGFAEYKSITLTGVGDD